jgi:hypothetical protein
MGARAVQAGLVLLLVLGAGRAAGSDVPVAIQAALVHKLLGYDRALKSRSHDVVVLAVITDNDKQPARQTLSTFRKLNGLTCVGREMKIVHVGISSGTHLVEELDSAGVHVIYVASGVSQATIKLVGEVAIAKKMPVYGGGRDHVRKGAAVGFRVTGGKPKIQVHLKTARAQGLDLSANVLRMAEVFR